MVRTNKLFAQVTIVLVLLAAAAFKANAQVTTYGCVTAGNNIYTCGDGDHPDWSQYNPYSWETRPQSIGSVLEVLGTSLSGFRCNPVPLTPSGNRAVVRGWVNLSHPTGGTRPWLRSRHSTRVQCLSAPPPPPPLPPMIVFNESPTNLEFILCLMGVRPGAPSVTIGTIQVGEAGDSCALDPDPGSGVDEIESPPNDL